MNRIVGADNSRARLTLDWRPRFTTGVSGSTPSSASRRASLGGSVTRVTRDAAADEFLRHRTRLLGIAYRLLGSMWDAEDVVSDAMVRWLRVDRSDIREPAAFLTTMVSRFALDQLKSARVDAAALRRTVAARADADRDVRARPARHGRAPRVGVGRDIARHGAAHATRARRVRAARGVRPAVRPDRGDPRHHREPAPASSSIAPGAAWPTHGQRFQADPEEHATLLDRFLRAVSSGDLADLEELLAADAVAYSDGGGKVRAAIRPIVGRANVIKFIRGSCAGSRWRRVRVIEANGRAAALLAFGRQTRAPHRRGPRPPDPRDLRDPQPRQALLRRAPDLAPRVESPPSGGDQEPRARYCRVFRYRPGVLPMTLVKAAMKLLGLAHPQAYAVCVVWCPVRQQDERVVDAELRTPLVEGHVELVAEQPAEGAGTDSDRHPEARPASCCPRGCRTAPGQWPAVGRRAARAGAVAARVLRGARRQELERVERAGLPSSGAASSSSLRRPVRASRTSRARAEARKTAGRSGRCRARGWREEDDPHVGVAVGAMEVREPGWGPRDSVGRNDGRAALGVDGQDSAGGVDQVSLVVRLLCARLAGWPEVAPAGRPHLGGHGARATLAANRHQLAFYR